MIKAVIFDWGGVLIDYPANDLTEYCSKHFKVNKEDFEKIFSKYMENFQKGLISENKIWENICKELRVVSPKTKSLWKEAVNHTFKDKTETYKLAVLLRKKGIKIGLLSNTEIPATEYFFENKYEKYFDAITFSCKEGLLKPEKEIYLDILKKLKIKPEEAIFIDDKIEFVNAAKELGINAIKFKDHKHLETDINIFIPLKS